LATRLAALAEHLLVNARQRYGALWRNTNDAPTRQGWHVKSQVAIWENKKTPTAKVEVKNKNNYF